MDARRVAEKEAACDGGAEDDGEDDRDAESAGVGDGDDGAESAGAGDGDDGAESAGVGDGDDGAESAGPNAGPNAGPPGAGPNVSVSASASASASTSSASFLWQPMTRVSIATDLPLELFQDDDAAYDWRVIAAEEKMRDERVRVDATGAEKAMHAPAENAKAQNAKAQNAEARNAEAQNSFDFSDAASDATSMDDETARRIAGERRDAAERLARLYDANVADASRRRSFIGATAPRRPPMRCGGAGIGLADSRRLVARIRKRANAPRTTRGGTYRRR